MCQPKLSNNNQLSVYDLNGHLKFSKLLPNMGKVKQIHPFGSQYLLLCDNALISSPNGLQGPYKLSSNSFKTNLFINDIALYGQYIYKPENSTIVAYNRQLNITNTTVSFIKNFYITSLAAADSERLYIAYKRGCALNDKPLPYLSDVFINRVRCYNGIVYWASNEGIYSIPEKAATDSSQLRKISNFVAHDIHESQKFIYLHNENEWIAIEKSSQKLTAKFKMIHFPVSGFINSLNTDSSHLVICTDQNVITVPLADIEAYQEEAPKIYFRNHGQKNSLTDSTLKLCNKQKLNIEIEVEIVDYSQKSYYSQYRILKDNNLISNWSSNNDKTEQKINLYKPQPGKYTIQYRLTGTDSHWNITKNYTIDVLPLWWQTDWFLTLCALLILIILGVIIYYIALFYSKKADRKIAQETRLFELESKNKLAQLKPHFIFNAIAPLQNFILNNDKRGGLEYIQHFSTMVRLGFRNKTTTIADEIDFLNNYLFVQQKRFNGNLVVNIECSDNLDPKTKLIPTMMIQPIVENAIEHGLNRNLPDQKIEISFIESAGNLTINIQDNGIGLPENFTFKQNRAMQILLEQIDIIKQKQGIGQLKISNRTDQNGVLVQIILPLQNI